MIVQVVRDKKYRDQFLKDAIYLSDIQKTLHNRTIQIKEQQGSPSTTWGSLTQDQTSQII